MEIVRCEASLEWCAECDKYVEKVEKGVWLLLNRRCERRVKGKGFPIVARQRHGFCHILPVPVHVCNITFTTSVTASATDVLIASSTIVTSAVTTVVTYTCSLRHPPSHSTSSIYFPITFGYGSHSHPPQLHHEELFSFHPRPLPVCYLFICPVSLAPSFYLSDSLYTCFNVLLSSCLS